MINNNLDKTYILYKRNWRPPNERNIIYIPYDMKYESLYKDIKQNIRNKYPSYMIITRLNNSTQKIIRCKDANYKLE